MQLTEILNQNLLAHLKTVTPNHHIFEVYKYAIFPTGKLFRPKIVWSIAKDFSATEQQVEIDRWSEKSDHAYLASLLEIHHAYTLVHDDMPAMDDDEMRRGKASTHIEFGQWKALLVGDGLLNASYQLLGKISCDKMSPLLKLVTHCLGAKGLIHGQVLDLSQEMTKDFKTLIKTHELKTARLIQTAIVGSYFLVHQPGSESFSYRTAIDLAKLGYSTGIVFQLLDDLTEFADPTLSQHESEVSPWFNFSEDSFLELTKGLTQINNSIEKYSLSHFKTILDLYYAKIRSIIETNRSIILTHLERTTISEENLNEIFQKLFINEK